MSKPLPTLIYLMNTEYPNQKAHSVQLTKLLASLKGYYQVQAFFQKITVPQDAIYEAVKAQYGYDLSHVQFHAIGKKSFTGLRGYWSIWKMLQSAPKDAFFYTRKFGMAHKIIQTRWLHKRKVVIESHKKDGYYKEEHVANSPYQHIRDQWECEKRAPKELQKTFAGVDLALFTSSTSQKIVQHDIPHMHSGFIWYPLDLKRPFTGQAREKQFTYCGALRKSKLIDLLIDAILLAPDHICIDCYGGASDDVVELIQQKGLGERIRLKGWLPYAELATVLQQYTYGISTMEGLKVVDYLEYGVVPLCPMLATYTDVFNDTLHYFEADNPQSLAALMAHPDKSIQDWAHLKNIASQYDLPNFGAKLHQLFRANL